MTVKIAYEPHPITPERKAELRAQGYKIIDARFAPAGAAPVEEKPKPAPRKRKAKAKAKPEQVNDADTDH